MNCVLPERKHPRLKNYDYSTDGAYFVTICTQNRRCILSDVVGRGLAPAETVYTQYGEIAHRQLLLLEQRYDFLKISEYIIMPNHIHIIFVLENKTAGASPRPTIMDIVCAYKSLTTRECKTRGFQGRLFQTSFYEHIIRSEKDYQECAKYIDENPTDWKLDELYTKE